MNAWIYRRREEREVNKETAGVALIYTHKPGCTDGREHQISHLAPCHTRFSWTLVKPGPCPVERPWFSPCPFSLCQRRVALPHAIRSKKPWPGWLILVDPSPARLRWEGPIATAFTDPGPAGGGAGSWNAGHLDTIVGIQVTGLNREGRYEIWIGKPTLLLEWSIA